MTVWSTALHVVTATLYDSANEICLFSILDRAAPPDLHSFPTRRSSDLVVLAKPIEAAGGSRVAGEVNALWTTIAAEVSAVKDRKSTRLNSSHVSISYAVFCLKKKNSTTRVAPASPITKPSRSASHGRLA